MLRHRVRVRPRKFSHTFGFDKDGAGSGPEGRLRRMRQVVGALFRYERLETTYERSDEARGYAERLIQIAMKNGDKHRPTMEMADYWLEEKDLIHKLFKVLVPRYRNSKTSYTNVWNLPIKYPGDGRKLIVLELKDNPWPPMVPKVRNTKYLLTNILLDAAREDYQHKVEEKRTKDSLSHEQSDIEIESSTIHAVKSEIGDHVTDNASENVQKDDDIVSDVGNLKLTDKEKNT